MLKYIKIIPLLLFFPTILQAQTISGKVESSTGEKIEHAQIILKDSVKALQMCEFQKIEYFS
jgi:hypothetical protein